MRIKDKLTGHIELGRLKKLTAAVRRATGQSVSPDARLELLHSHTFGRKPRVFDGHSTLTLKEEDGTVTSQPGQSMLFREDGTVQPVAKKIANIILQRHPHHQLQIDQAVTDAHAQHEMWFGKKNPDTGRYDLPFAVPSQGIPVPIPKSSYDMYVKSTAPVMRACRDLLQRFYSTPEATVEDLGLDRVPENERDWIFAALKSIYFEPKLIAPQMKDYPFLPVVGFDAALSNREDAEPLFFEFNSGTPSGLSNNQQLLEILRQTDPEVFAALRDHLPQDDTFSILKRVIDDSALAWTGNEKGISVVVGPGTMNGAHPDVASIALLSNMPLVEISELYQDENGDIRLNTGHDQAHPVVTGVYGRVEESTFLQDSDRGLPLRWPQHNDNQEVGERIGAELERGVAYDFIYNEDNEITDVNRNPDGSPKLLDSWVTIGQHPTDPDQPKGSFLDAILNKKLFYSGLGGRLVDDKRLFQVVSDHLAPDFCDAEDDPIARPPETLHPSQYDEFYETDRPEDYVVKVPDRSGGDGVHLMYKLSAEERAEVVQDVKDDPFGHIVQRFLPSAVTPAPRRFADGTMGLANRMFDLRMYTMMDSKGRVDAGPNSILIRVADEDSASTNNSQGAGYGIGVVMTEEPTSRFQPDEEPEVLTRFSKRAVGAERMTQLHAFLDSFKQLLEWTDPLSGGDALREGNARRMAEQQRLVMDLLGRDFAPVMDAARAFEDGNIESVDLHLVLLQTRAKLLSRTKAPGTGVGRAIRASLASYKPAPVEEWNQTEAPSRKEVFADLCIEHYRKPRQVRIDEREGQTFETFEVGRYTASEHRFVAQAISRLATFGGELRAVRRRAIGQTEWDETPASPHFRIDRGRPIICIDLAQRGALSGLAHELAHLETWLDTLGEIKKRVVPSRKEKQRAIDVMNAPANRVESERRSVLAEIEMDRRDDSPMNWQPKRPVLGLTDRGYAQRVGYPYLEGVHEALFNEKFDGKRIDDQEVHGFLADLIRLGLKNRMHVARAHRRQAKLHRRGNLAHSKVLALREEASAYATDRRSLFDVCVSGKMRDRFRHSGTLERLEALFWRSVDRLGLHDELTDFCPLNARPLEDFFSGDQQQ